MSEPRTPVTEWLSAAAAAPAHPLVTAMAGRDEPPKDKRPEVGERLLKTRQAFLSGVVMQNSARDLIRELLALEADDAEKPITLFVNSPGGSVSDGFAIYDTIKFIKPPVRILSFGLCASIATIILIATPKRLRLTTPNTRLLIHQPLLPSTVFGPASDLEITANEMLKTRGKINEMLAEACDQPLEKVARDTQRDFWMSAEEAVEYGLVTTIVTSRDQLEAVV